MTSGHNLGKVVHSDRVTLQANDPFADEGVRVDGRPDHDDVTTVEEEGSSVREVIDFWNIKGVSYRL